MRSKKEQERDDLHLAQKIKPKLRKFLIDEQTKAADKRVKANEEEVKKLAAMETAFKEVIARARKLSQIAFFEERLWRTQPPVVEMTWLHASGTSPELEAEQHQDTWAFARYLVKEYFGNYQSQQNTQQGYPSPLDRKNLSFFWQKFNTDISLAVLADLKRVKAGNEGAIVVTPKKEEPKIIV
jgi:hypothetical protein